MPGDSVQVLLRLVVGACTNRELRRSANCIRRQLASHSTCCLCQGASPSLGNHVPWIGKCARLTAVWRTAT